MTTKTERRTKRRYAHELYPHPDESETRPLAVDVPYLLALASGFEIDGTGWFDLTGPETTKEQHAVASARIMYLIEARRLALTADALLQGMSGDEAWQWAQERANEESGEWIWERAEHYGIDPELIKPYPCGDEPDHHDHLGEPGSIGRLVTRVQGKESECDECTEEVPA